MSGQNGRQPDDAHTPVHAPPPSHLRTLWDGRGRPATRWRSLLGGIFALLLAGIMFNVALATIRWAMPLKLVGIGSLALVVALLFLGCRALMRVILQLGLKRLIIRLTILYLVAVLIVGLTTSTGQQGLSHWLGSAADVIQLVVSGLRVIGRTVAQAPDAIAFAATGQRQPVRVPGGIEWIDGAPPTPVVANIPAAEPEAPAVPTETVAQNLPGLPSTHSSDLGPQIGDTVRVVGTDGAPLRARSSPSTTASIVTRFPAGGALKIVDGPQTVDGRTWWKLRGDKGEGWCAAEFLAVE
jgi:hypothetical protein